MKKVVLFALGLIVVLGGVALLYWRESAPKDLVQNDNWLVYSDNATGVSFSYPETFETKYIHAVDWPPQAQILKQPYACAEAGVEIERAGKTEKRLVDNREYCRTTVVGGAAGSTYTQYAYAFSSNNSTAILTFTIRAVQCANYDEVERVACEGEREAFDIDGMVDRIARSITLK